MSQGLMIKDLCQWATMTAYQAMARLSSSSHIGAYSTHLHLQKNKLIVKKIQ